MPFESQIWKQTERFSVDGTLGLTSAEQLLSSTSSPMFILRETTLKRTILPTPVTIKPAEEIQPETIDVPEVGKSRRTQ
jgi:hypothetical protein